ncbi:MAG: protein translocase subunit SecD [Propionibacteriaceae bacterium]|nr:protein translocase subunit SecD [Propionibacteriaceae bacterium]
MATPTPTPTRRHPAAALIGLLAVMGLLGLIMALSDTWTPKLGLDLSGGTSITLTATNRTGGGIDADSLEQARTIIEQRVNSLGVGEAEVATSGSNQVVVSVPNVQGNELVDMVGTTAQLSFRRVYQVDYAYSGADPTIALELPQAPADASQWRTEAETELPTDEAGRQTLLKELLEYTPTDEETAAFADWSCGDEFPDVWDQVLFACLRDDQLSADMRAAGVNQKYLLGPQLIEGERVSSASAGIPQNQPTWIVELNFDDIGTTLFSDVSTALVGATEPTNQFGIVLDADVISAPRMNDRIPNGSASISGSFTQTSATNLANVLKYGALPLNFELGNVENVSATLGSEQLRAGLIAGAIGLGLVVIYSFLYYRGLAVVVIASLAVAGVTTYALIVLLGQAVGFALSLPGLAGVIVAIGVTADSFVILFERVRDEAREGRSVRTAVETGWRHARRTIVVADAVSLLSAVILFVLSIGAVKGFAFALGLTTLIDLAVVFFFTKPVTSLLVRTAFFGQGRRGSGLEAEHLGVNPARRPQPSRRRLATAGKEA